MGESEHSVRLVDRTMSPTGLRRRLRNILVILWPVFAVGSCGGRPAVQSPAASTAIPVRVDVARRHEVTPSLHASGYISARNHIEVSSEVAGRVTKIYFESGQPVKAGDVLVQLDDSIELAEKKRSAAQLAYSQKELVRLRSLVSVGVSQSKLDAVQLELDVASHDVEALDSVIEKKLITAPFDGVLGIRKVYLGQTIAPTESIVSLSDTSTLYVNFSIPERFFERVSLGGSVSVKPHALGGAILNGTITSIDPQVESNEHMLNIQASLSDPSGSLLHGMFAEVTIPYGTVEGKVLVPEVSVVPATYGSSVFVVLEEEGRSLVQRRNVTIGKNIDGLVVVESGLEAGESVVLFGQNRLRDQLEVEVQHESETPVAREDIGLGVSGPE